MMFIHLLIMSSIYYIYIKSEANTTSTNCHVTLLFLRQKSYVSKFCSSPPLSLFLSIYQSLSLERRLPLRNPQSPINSQILCFHFSLLNEISSTVSLFEDNEGRLKCNEDPSHHYQPQEINLRPFSLSSRSSPVWCHFQ